MNRLKLAQFARDTNQKPIHFDSRDKFDGEIEDEAPKKVKKKSVKPSCKKNLINSKLQDVICHT